MNQRRYIEHNLFLQSSNSKHINQVLLKSYSGLAQALLKPCESSYQNISLNVLHNTLHNVLLRSYSTPYSSLNQVLIKSCSSLTQYLTQVLLKSYSSLTQHLTQVLLNILLRSCEILAQNISPRNFNEFGNAFFYS